MNDPEIIADGTIIEWDCSIQGHLTGEVLEDHSALYLKVGYYRAGLEGLTITPNLARRRLTVSQDQSDAHKITAHIARNKQQATTSRLSFGSGHTRP